MPKAAVLFNYKEPLRVVDVAVDDPGPGEVKVRVKAAGVCHSDLHVMKGDLPLPLPMVLGHEGAGVVEAVGPGVTRVGPGDHVVFSWIAYCEECHYCRSGRPDMCVGVARQNAAGVQRDGTTRFRIEGQPVRQMTQIGCFSEVTVVPETGAVPIPKEFPLDRAALVGCAVTTGVGAAIKTARVAPGSSVAVIGCGGVGLNVIQGAHLAGAERIIAIDVVPAKLDHALAFGATHTVNAREQDPVKAVQDLTDGLGADYAFEVIGNPATIQQAFHMIRRAGLAVVVGVAPFFSEVSLPAFAFPSMTKTITGTWFGQANPPVDIPRMLSLYRAGRLKLDELISRTYRLEEINEAYAALEAGHLARGVIIFD